MIALVYALFAAVILEVSAPDPSPLAAALTCTPEPAPGRVACELELEIERGRLAWFDAVVLSAPDFAPPLRARVASSSASSRTDRRARLPISLLARREGRGTLAVRARAVVCDGRRCRTEQRDVEAEVKVGAD